MENDALINRLKTCLSGHSPLIYRHVIFQCGCHLKNSVVIQTCLQLHEWHKNNPLRLLCARLAYLPFIKAVKMFTKNLFCARPLPGTEWKVKVAQMCPTLCDSMDCNIPGSSVHGDSSDKNSGVGRGSLLQGIFPIQRSKQGLLHCWWFFTIWATRGATRVVGGVIKRNSMEW